MKAKSRREFIESCKVIALGGLASPLLLSLTGCDHDTSAEAKTADIPPAQIDPKFEPAYLKLHRTGDLKKRGEALWQIMENCMLCPRECGINRLEGKTGICRASSRLDISSYHAHFGEEQPLVGRRGSGTIFFTHCGLRCVFCINWEINHDGRGSPRRIEELADMMLRLQEQGCGNINVVTPTHYSPHILLALDIAAGMGLRLPVVYNSSGWER
ncbi:MAG TPA: radical SAM protein, partial [Acidobacteriota bacterium]|nr:radical SAM protein [Acidobacteriota bacterium]